jgi:Zn-dependent protease with chaperone function
MNFFQSQQAARRNTRVMVVLFLLAVVAIVVAIDLVAAAAWISMHPPPRGVYAPLGARLARVPGWVFAMGAILTAGAILVVSLFNIAMLRAGGGEAVARMVGGRRVAPNTRDPLEKRLLNVVEEMAIASGTRVPAVYVMDEEQGINAFAAGYDISSSVVAVTRGTLETLNRDELQGVIGHEFSHIVNGDMSLNIRMIGVLAGIVFLGAVGGFILRNARGRGKEAGAIFIVGLGLYVIGYVGLFFARIIKAMVAREREYLADASGVQFTRNPDGLAGALDQIRASGRQSLITARKAEDVSHLFFGEAIHAGLFATHPPLDERIKRINPRFQPQAYRGKRLPATELAAPESGMPEAALGFAGGGVVQGGDRGGDAGQKWGKSPAESADLVGRVTDEKVIAAQRMLAAIPAGVRERVREPGGAAATVLSLILANTDDVMAAQVAAAKAAGAGAIAEAAAALAGEMRTVGPAYYMPIVDLALPALKAAPAEEHAQLVRALEAAINADRRISIFEFILATLMKSQLGARPKYAPPRYRSLAEVRREVLFLISLVAFAGGKRGPNAETEIAAAFRAGVAQTGFDDAAPLRRDELRMEDASAVLEKLRDLAPMPKAVLVKALFAAVTADGSIRVVEAALMRTIGAVLDCPLPPLLEQTSPDALAA